MTRDEFIAEAKRQGKSREETLAKYQQLVASGAFGDSPKSNEPRPMDQRVGTDSAQEEFDRYRPKLTDEYLGEDIGRSVDAGIMGMGEQIRSFQRGLQNLNPFQTDEQEAELDRQAAAAESFAEDGYGTSNPVATAAGEFATTAPTMLLPGGLPMQMAYGGIEAGLDHSSTDNAGVDAAIGAATTGIFGKAFDLMGRAFGNTAEAGVNAVSGRQPSVPGQTADETKRLLQFAKEEGVNLTPAQRSRQRRQFQDEARMSSNPSGQKLHDIYEEQQRQINQMVADRFGIENGTQLTSDVMNQVDRKVSAAYKEAEAGLTRTTGDEQFLTDAAEAATVRGLTDKQSGYLDDVAMDIADGMDGKDVIRLRKELQRAKKNAQTSNGDYADALHTMVESLDDLIERTAPTEVGAKFANARDMARMQMALEKGASVGKDGNINARSLDTALGNVYKREFKRGHGHSNEGTQRVFDAARLGNFLRDGIPNSGTATREYRGYTDQFIDSTLGRSRVDFYLKNPGLYGLFDPMGELAKATAYRAGRGASMDGEEVEENLLGIDR
jgi:hypothetical protein